MITTRKNLDFKVKVTRHDLKAEYLDFNRCMVLLEGLIK